MSLAFDATMSAEVERYAAAMDALALATSRSEAAENALAAADLGGLLAMPKSKDLKRSLTLSAWKPAIESPLHEWVEFEADEKLKTAKAQWDQQAATALGEVEKRCKRAETASASAGADTANADAYVRGLNAEVKRLQVDLVNREASAAHADARMEKIRVGAISDAPALRWRPILNRPDPKADLPANRGGKRLARDVAIVFALVIMAVVLFPQVQGMLPGSMSGRIAALGGPTKSSDEIAISQHPALVND